MSTTFVVGPFLIFSLHSSFEVSSQKSPIDLPFLGGPRRKVEFNQPSCWLYSIPNLLVI